LPRTEIACVVASCTRRQIGVDSWLGGPFDRLTDVGRLQLRLSRALDRDVELIDPRRADLLVVERLRQRRSGAG